jgi:hypothetical protein
MEFAFQIGADLKGKVKEKNLTLQLDGLQLNYGSISSFLSLPFPPPPPLLPLPPLLLLFLLPS